MCHSNRQFSIKTSFKHWKAKLSVGYEGRGNYCGEKADILECFSISFEAGLKKIGYLTSENLHK